MVFFGVPTFTVQQLKAVYGQDANVEVVSVDLEEHTAKIYDNQIKFMIKPKKANYCLSHTYHVYCILYAFRDNLQEYLKSKNIDTVIHYPETLQQIKVLNLYEDQDLISNLNSRHLLSLPIHPFMTTDEAEYVCEAINAYRR